MVKRYNVDFNVKTDVVEEEEDANGEWVKWEDHKAAIDELHQRNKESLDSIIESNERLYGKAFTGY